MDCEKENIVYNIDKLPEELLVKIFSYLDETTILRGRCVSKLWNEILCDITFPTFNIWNPTKEISSKNLREIFLEACKKGSVDWVDRISKFICNNLFKLNYCSHNLWNDGIIIGTQTNHLDVVKLISNFGVSHGKYEALKESVKNGNSDITNFLLNEFQYTDLQLSRVFDQTTFL